MTPNDGRPLYASEVTSNVVEFILAHVSRETTLGKIEAVVSIIEEFPGMGHVYDPECPAARTPFPCRYIVVPETPFTIHYLKDDVAHKVVVFDIEWSAGDPVDRFRAL